MKEYVYYIAAVLLLVIGFAVGYNTRKAGEVTQARQEVKEAKAQVKVDDTAQRKQAEKLSDDLADAQLKSLDLERKLADLTQANASLKERISHAQFIAPQRITVSGSCPDPFSSLEFGRLYNAAAQAASAH